MLGTETSERRAVGQQGRGVDRVVPGVDTRGRQRRGARPRGSAACGQLALVRAAAASRSRWVSTMAPTAAVMSSALVDLEDEQVAAEDELATAATLPPRPRWPRATPTGVAEVA